MEASGTSGIKAAFNGVPHLSVLDGWWIEGHIEGVTGWSIEHHGNDDKDAHSLYLKFEETILPLFYEKQIEWQGVMKSAISKNSRFNSHHMMRRYVAEAYIS
jgi:starch phosphorylase